MLDGLKLYCKFKQKLDISKKTTNNRSMQPLAPLIKDLAVILGVASLVTLLFQKIRQPVVLGYLLSGIIVGPHVLHMT